MLELNDCMDKVSSIQNLPYDEQAQVMDSMSVGLLVAHTTHREGSEARDYLWKAAELLRASAAELMKAHAVGAMSEEAYETQQKRCGC